jgi:hypothetical protein
MRAMLMLLILFSSLTLFACGEDEPPPVDPAPTIGVLELPISLRSVANAPANAARLQVSPTELGFDGRKLLDLDGGLVAAGDRADDVISPLRSAIQGGAARRSAVVEMHVNVPYQTTTLILATLAASGVREVAFAVRKPGATTPTYLVLDHWRVAPFTDEPVVMEGEAQRSWADMVLAWEDAYTACRRDHYVDCNPKPTYPAAGGRLEMRFFSRGSAVKAEFRQFDAPETPEQLPPEMLEGVPPPPTAQPGEEIIVPVDHGAFTWRFEAATDELSPISAAFRPLCGARACGIVVTGDVETMTMRIVSMLGAAFPDGTPAPHVVFLIPSR